MVSRLKVIVRGKIMFAVTGYLLFARQTLPQVLEVEQVQEAQQEQPSTSAAVPEPEPEIILPEQQVEEQQLEDEQLCIICMAEPKTVGFAHGETMHRCICLECSQRFEVGNPCPICKQPIQLILKKVYD
eukprot:TRINITY_DN5902_c0_g2_i1.p3 TRINITY_DN5902_c0_g2~~TRINITY_DN5902_c0_g2_i1.p3  ORF type:complete len:139 (-),score=9.08 TRINITY_DN5902_c0_g2_i1:397-783(-)